MPRPTRQRIDHLESLVPLNALLRTPVTARVVNQTVLPAAGDDKTDALLNGLSALNPALARYGEVKDRNDELDGAEARTSGQAKDESKGAAWVKGYLRMDGAVKGQQDSALIEQRFATEFDRERGDVESFISKQYGSLVKGMPDAAFKSGYDEALAPTFAKLRKEFVTYHRERAVEKTESNAMFFIEKELRKRVGSGQTLEDSAIDATRQQLNETMGVSNRRFGELLFGAAQRVGDEGHFEVYEMFKRSRPDGTPGMYFIPEWKAKIDQAELRAKRAFVTNQDQAELRARKEREDKQDTALFSVFNRLTSGDEKGARTEFDELRRNGLFSRAADVVKWEAMFDQTSKREARPEQNAAHAELLTGIYKRTVKMDDVINALSNRRITNSQFTSAMATINQVRSEDRTFALQADAAPKKIFKTPQYAMSEEFIKGQLKSQVSREDVFGLGSLFDQQQRAAAVLEFNQRALSVKDPDELHTISREIVDRTLKLRTQLKDAKEMELAGRVRYANIDDAIAAARRGELTPESLREHTMFYRNLHRQRTAPKK